jgi:hypothetical protein
LKRVSIPARLEPPRQGAVFSVCCQVGLSLRVQGKSEDAELVKREFKVAWAKADIQLKLEDI